MVCLGTNFTWPILKYLDPWIYSKRISDTLNAQSLHRIVEMSEIDVIIIQCGIPWLSPQ